ncbi:MAG: hypothetical protein C4562_00790 [Actinobacteria bacterium]|nr:MAG: hypothetical protein C4562_00790 [Actinomycetota bacterium]
MLNKTAKEALLIRAIDDIDKLTHRGYLYAGLPHFNCLFGRDSIICSLQLLDYNPGYARKTLLKLASMQGKRIDHLSEEEPGKIIHENRLRNHELNYKWKFPYYGSADSTPLFIVLLAKYYKKTKDISLVQSLWPKALKALDWMREYGDFDSDLFIEYHRKNPQGLRNQCWKDSLDSVFYSDGHLVEPPISSVEIQGYKYQALISLNYLAEIINKKLPVEQSRINDLRKKINDCFWVKRKKFFAIGLDSAKEQIAIISSNPGHLLYSEAIDEDKAAMVVERLMKPDMFSGWGIRTISSREIRFSPFSYHNGSIWFHDNWIICEGMKKYGFTKEAALVRKSLMEAALHLNCIPELFCGIARNGKAPMFNDNACHIQAWSAASIVNWLNSH